jgi:hypothetical protein
MLVDQPGHPFQKLVENTHMNKAIDTLKDWIKTDISYVIQRKQVDHTPSPLFHVTPLRKKEKTLKKSSSYATDMLDDPAEELKEPLLDSQRQQTRVLSSQHTMEQLKSKLSILELTMQMIGEKLKQMELATSYAVKVKERVRSIEMENNLQNIKNDYFKRE